MSSSSLIRKLPLLVAAVWFSTALPAQGLIERVFPGSEKTWYKGQTRDKKPHGMGIWKTKDGMLHIGDFFQGKINGYGMTLAADGSKIAGCDNAAAYAGSWKNGEKAGAGTCYDENGFPIYTGKFEKDKPAGTYPTQDDFSFRLFSLFEYEDGDKYLGETDEGLFHGFGVYFWAGGDLWFGNFREGEFNGVGLYLAGDGEWAILNYTADGCEQIDSSGERADREVYEQAARVELRALNRELLSEAFGYFNAAVSTANEAAGLVRSMRSGGTSSYSDEGSGGGGGGSSGGSASSGGSEGGDCGDAWRADSRTYSSYETQLIKMRTNPENYSNYTSDYTGIQSKMRQIRQKWESRGCKINKSPHEDG